jgi:nitronate monooxygenase
MGVGISAHALAGKVSSLGGVGTISSIDLRRLHPDLMAKTDRLPPSDKTKAAINEANLIALEREISSARELASGYGMLAVNVMRAVSEYQPYITKALESGIDAVVVGAGLPLDLPDLAQDFPKVNLIPILSDARGLQLIVKKWERKGRLPNAIILEHPRLAGGHLGANKIEDLNNPKYDFINSITESIEFLKSAGLEGHIPLIAAGGITSREDIAQVQAYGASGVQIGTAFAVTHESAAHPNFKKTLAEAKLEDIVEFISVAGLPARAIKTPWLIKYLATEPKLKAVAHKKAHCTMSFDCLIECGLRDGNAAVGGQFR